MRTKAIAAVLVLTLGAACASGDDGGRASTPAGESFLAPPEGWDPTTPVFSPDGEHVAWFGTDNRFRPRVGIVDDGRLIPLTPSSMRAADVAWMPDSDALLVAHQHDRRTKLAVVDLEGRILDRIEPSERIVSDWSGMFVLDDDTAVISAMTTWGTMSPTDLYSVDLKTGATENVTRSRRLSEHWPVWIDDSRWLFTGGLITTQQGGPTGWAGVFYPDTGEHERLTEPSFFVDVATIVPGSSRVVFDTAFQDDQGIFETDLFGSEPVRLLEVREMTQPAISPDGRRLLLHEVGTPGNPGGFVEFELPPPASVRGPRALASAS